MKISFKKYQGTGNDFVLIDNTGKNDLVLDTEQIQKICDRKFGIGSDGIIVIKDSLEHDFHMHFHNPDGSQSFCGNGARCAVHFANEIGLLKQAPCSFEAIDGVHRAYVCMNEVKLEMSSIGELTELEHSFSLGSAYMINTGSPHIVSYVDRKEDLERIVEVGREIRYSKDFLENGVNVNLLQASDAERICIATYERGVENETLSCGTGATACALVYAFKKNLEEGSSTIGVQTRGGDLKVSFDKTGKAEFSNVYLIGPAKMIFNGQIEI